ncbi:hypothetical protein Tco_1112819 [Tanacetum coccineum]|uniref:Retrovirus-related Pol polyprotein from transposon TNT 1-94-like beta-barrel domain-containing protein n=1 Tax=Tanacetum coccineum TaxID=301880 RepID=A0ABQ5IRM4_9ASTR
MPSVCTARPSVSTARPICTARPSVSTARPVCTAKPNVSTARPVYATRPIYPRMDNVRPRGSCSPIKRSYYTKPAFRPKDLKQDVKTFGVQNMTTAGTRAVVNTGKGKLDTDLKKSRWVWRPKGNYLDHVSKDSGSFMLKKGNPEILLQDHAVVDSGCSSHMTGNKAYLSDYEDFNGGFVAFGSDPKGDSEHSTVTYTSVVNGPPIMPEDPYAYIMAVYQPMNPEYIPQEDEILPAKEQPLPTAALPTADSSGYVLESDPEEEPDEDDEDLEEDPSDFLADRDDEDNDDDDDDEEEEDEDEEEEEEEHPAPIESVPPIPSSSLPYITTPNSPTHIEIPESCLPLRKRVRFASPTPSHEVGESSVAGAARQDGPAVAREDPYSVAREIDYGITDTWDDLVGAIDEIAPTTLEGVNQRVTDLATIVEQETTIMYGIMEDAQDDRSQLRGRVNLSCIRDRAFHR